MLARIGRWWAVWLVYIALRLGLGLAEIADGLARSYRHRPQEWRDAVLEDGRLKARKRTIDA